MNGPAVRSALPLDDDTLVHEDTPGMQSGARHDRQDVPGDGSDLPPDEDPQDETPRGFPVALWRAVVLDSALTLAKSAEIAASGGRVWNAAVFACAWMSVEDAFEVHRARLTCKSIFGLLRLERDAAPRAVAELSMRNAVLGRIWVQIAQDIAHPLQQRSAMAYDGLFGAPSASGC